MPVLYSKTKMGLALFSEGAEPPKFPHFVCVDGFVWMDEEERQGCFNGTVSAESIVVERAIDPKPNTPGIDRMLSIAALSKAQLRRVFPAKCQACGIKHLYYATRYAQAVRNHIHPDAVEHLRLANVPDYLLREAWIIHDRANENANDKRRNYIPVWPNDPERTLTAQIAWAMQYAARSKVSRRHGRAKIVNMRIQTPTPGAAPPVGAEGAPR